MSATEFKPVTLTDAETLDWQRAKVDPALRSLALYAFNKLPRGKATVPRWIGRVLPGNRRICMTTSSGALLAIDRSHLDTYLVWEEQNVEALIAFTRQDDVVYDIGANVGYFSVAVTQAMNGRVDLYAFEPQPSLARHIAASAALNHFDRLHVYPFLVGDEEGHQRLFLAPHSVHASLVSRTGDSSQYVDCPMTRLDHRFARGELPGPNVIKMDVEGAELQVLQGMSRILTEKRPVIIFEADINARRFGHSKQDLFRFIADLDGYRFFAIGIEGIESVGLDQAVRHAANDYCAVPSEKLDQYGLIGPSASE